MAASWAPGLAWRRAAGSPRITAEARLAPRVVVIDSLAEGYGLGTTVSRRLADALAKFAADEGVILILVEEVLGHVARPGEYPIRTGTTLLQALSLAGGVTDRGSTSRVQVVRVVDGREKKLDIKLNERVYGGDTIIVRERFF